MTSSFSGIAFAASLGAATLTVPGLAGVQQVYATGQQRAALYSEVSYKTDFIEYSLQSTMSLSDSDKIAIINDLVQSLTKESVPLNERQHAILTDNLFDFL